MKRKSGLMSSLGYGAAGTVRGKKGDEASLWGRRGRSHAQSVPASHRFSANGTDGTWAKPGHPCPVPKEKRGRAASLCWTWKVLLAILFFFEALLYFYSDFFFADVSVLSLSGERMHLYSIVFQPIHALSFSSFVINKLERMNMFKKRVWTLKIKNNPL